MRGAKGVFTKGQLISAIPRFVMIDNLTEPDLTPTEVRSPLRAAFGQMGQCGAEGRK